MSMFPVKGMSGDPTFLALGALSLLVVLVALYLDGWKVITGSALGLVNLALRLAATFTLFFAAVERVHGLFGPPSRRSVHFTWAVIMTASSLLNRVYWGLVNDGSTPGGRFLKNLKP